MVFCIPNSGHFIFVGITFVDIPFLERIEIGKRQKIIDNRQDQKNIEMK